MGPLFTQGIISTEVNHILAFFIGIGFGFLLEAAGFTNTRKLAGVFYGYDMTVLKVFFTAALTAAAGLLILHTLGAIDLHMTYYPKTYWLPTLVGGLLMALGFLTGGFCPGTSFCAATTGKIDAMVFVGGIFLGIFGYAFTYEPIFEKFRNSYGLGRVNVADWIGIPQGLFILLMVIIAIVSFLVADKVQKKINAKQSKEDLHDLGLDE